MRELNPEHVRAMSQMANNCPYFQLVSMRIAELSWGQARLEIDLGQKHLQTYGIAHGGVMAALIDAAGWWAAYSQLEPELGLTTVEMKLNYLAPVTSGLVIGQGRTIKTGRTLSLADAQVQDAKGNVLAHGTVTLMALPGMKLPPRPEMPAKFL